MFLYRGFAPFCRGKLATCAFWFYSARWKEEEEGNHCDRVGHQLVRLSGAGERCSLVGLATVTSGHCKVSMQGQLALEKATMRI